MDNRAEQIENLIQKVLAETIAKDFCVSRDLIISVTRVQASGNLQEAKVYISVIPDHKREKIVAALEKNVVFFQKTLNHKLRMRPVPRIKFVPDLVPETAQAVETILEKLKNQEKEQPD